MTPQSLSNWGMLTRVLAVMLAGVLAVQLVTFTLLQFAPLPRPPMFSVAQVAAALRAGGGAKGDFVFDGRSPAPTQGGRATTLAVALADALGVDQTRVRVTLSDPPMLGSRPPGPERRGERSAGPDALLVGDFTAGFDRAGGAWITVRPAHSGLAAWNLRLLLFLLAALVTVIPFAWLLARWVTRPVALFADAAERIGRDPRTPPLAIDGPAEIVHAASAMNQMQDRLNRYVDDRTVMIGAIAHDLRTPLMRITLRLERAPETLRRAVEGDVRDMEAMIAAATDYVRDATRTGKRRRLDLRSLVESAVDDLSDRGEQVALLPGQPVVVAGDPVTLRTMLDNLLNNALRYAGDAEVSIEQHGNAALIEIRDHGPGMSSEDLARAFEPFYRGEHSRNRDTGGIGLGLASVRAVVHLHGGEAHLDNHADGGLVVRITLPG